jgi:hypothetical protein
VLGQYVKDTLCGTKVLYRDDYERIMSRRREFGGDDPFDLAVGDCLTEPVGYDVVDSVEIVDCNEPHYSEVFQSFIIDDGPYPGDAAVEEMAYEWCDEDFADFVGVPYVESALDYEILIPSQETWEDMNDREILCMVYDPAGDTVGTLQGANL